MKANDGRDMTDTKDQETPQDAKKKLALAGKSGGRLELRSPGGAGGDAGSVRQSFPHGRSKTVQVEVRKKRVPGAAPAPAPAPAAEAAATKAAAAASGPAPTAKPQVLRTLTDEERTARQRAIQSAIRADVEAKRRNEDEARKLEEDLKRKSEDDAKRKTEEVAQKKVDNVVAQKADEEQKKRAEEETLRLNEEENKRRLATEVARAATLPPAVKAAVAATAEDEDRPRRPGAFRPGQGPGRPGAFRPPSKAAPEGGRDLKERRQGKISVTQALDNEETIRVRSLAAMKRAREKPRSCATSSSRRRSRSRSSPTAWPSEAWT
jgi:translation initiation factor IF-2